MSQKLRLEIILDKAQFRSKKCQSSDMNYLRQKLGFAQIKAIALGDCPELEARYI